MQADDERVIKELIEQYFQLGKTKELDKIPEFLSPGFHKFGDSPPFERRDGERALTLEQLQFASISDYDFIIQDLLIDRMDDVAVATFVLESSGMVVDDYSFRGATVKSRARTTIVLQKRAGKWKMTHQHMSRFAG